MEKKIEFFEAKECERCGACCCSSVIGIAEVDLRREPKLREFAVPAEPFIENKRYRNLNYVGLVMDVYGRCPFLEISGKVTLCSIYSTRPDACRNFQPIPFRCKVCKLENAGVDVEKMHAESQGISRAEFAEWIMALDMENLNKCEDIEQNKACSIGHDKRSGSL